MTWIAPRMTSVPVGGGELTVARWGRGPMPVIASHGITANHRSFGEVAAQLGADAGVTLWAVDHRGRGGSAQLPGPVGLDAHARDLLAVADQLALQDVVLVGHSMGAYVVARAAELAPERVGGLVLVDGGLPVPLDPPPDTDIEHVVHSVIGPALERLDLSFSSVDEYIAMWRQHPAVGGTAFTDVVEAYVRYDLEADGAAWRSVVRKDAVLADGRSTLVDEGARTAVERVGRPTTLLWAPRGVLDQEPGLLPPELVAAKTAELDHLRAQQVRDVNHYTILFDPAAAAVVAAAVSDAAATD